MAVASVTQPPVTIPDPKVVSATVVPVAVPMERAAWLPAAPLASADKNDPHGWYQRALSAEDVTRGMDILSLAVRSLSPRERAETHTFTRHTLEQVDPHLRPFALPADRYTWAAPSWSVMVKADQRVVTQPGGRVRLEGEVAVFLPCQGDAEWPSGTIDLCGSPW